MIIGRAILAAAGSALILAFPVAVQAQADPSPPATMPTTDPAMAAPAASAPASAVAQTPPPATDNGAAAKDYPRCSATVTDSCVQGGGGSKAHHGKSARHKKG